MLDPPLDCERGARTVMRASSLTATAVVTLLAFGSGCSADHSPGPETYTREKLLRPETCNECHQDHYQEWLGSMHAYASTDPVFQAMNKRGQEETHGELKNFCVKCHAPMAVQEMGDNEAIDPTAIPEQLRGVTCYFCHNVTEIEGKHFNDNPLHLANDTTMRGGVAGPLPYKAHGAAYSNLHDSVQPESATLCGSCHDIVVPGHFSGSLSDSGVPRDVPLEQTFTEWQGSIFNRPGNAFLTCGNCHMDIGGVAGNSTIANPPSPHPTMPSNRTRHLHDFPAVDTAFAVPDFGGGQAAGASRVQAFLDSELRVETCVSGDGSGLVNVTLENLRAGHHFPSGASQDRRLWIEVHVSDGHPANNTADKHTYDNGVVAPGQEVTAAEEDAKKMGEPLNLFRDVTTKADGTPAHMFWDVANITSDTIPVLKDLTIPLGNAVPAHYVTGVRQPKTVTVTVWLEPIGLDVINDLRRSGHLVDGSLGDGGFDRRMPRYALIPARIDNPDAGAITSLGNVPATQVWTAAEADGGKGYVSGNFKCLQTTPNAFAP